MLPDSSEEVYLTGLSAANVEEIQQAVLDSYIGGKPMYLNNLHFIDAEKTKAGDNDDNLCWAASCSNLLTYTGWAQQAGFQTEDEVFDLYVSSFTNNGGWRSAQIRCAGIPIRAVISEIMPMTWFVILNM